VSTVPAPGIRVHLWSGHTDYPTATTFETRDGVLVLKDAAGSILVGYAQRAWVRFTGIPA
jgi:hypothetical protein